MPSAAMEMSHGPHLTRMYTAPVNLSTTTRADRDPNPNKMIGHGPRSSKMSQSTLTSASSASLNTLSTVPTSSSTNSGTVIATANIINQKADASRSLYQICVSLRQRLLSVPGFEDHLREADIEGIQQQHDVVVSLWKCLQKGYPLITIYNVLQPEVSLQADDRVSEAKRAKSAASKFVLRCLSELKLPAEEVFVLNDLFGEDTTGFLKVTQVVNVVLNIAVERGLLHEDAGEEASGNTGTGVGGKMSYRDHVVKELVDTERKYVQDLENLHELKTLIEQKGVVPGDVVHAIFLNINAILDFQRRFLIRIETTNSQPENRQEWGGPFTFYEEAFEIYQPFIANQRKAADIAKREFDKLHLANHPVVEDFNTLDGFLLKPMQRLVKYPLLLKDLRDKTGADEITKAELQSGIDAANRVLFQANAAVDRELRSEAFAELKQRVEDWKQHDVHQFGELLLHGVFQVVTGKNDTEKEVKTYTVAHPDMPMMPTSSNTTPSAGLHASQKNQYTIYLFERILLCCKELNPNKATKDKLLGGQKAKKDAKEKAAKDKKAGVTVTTKLQLKGRIFMTNVTDVISMAKPGSYTVQIYWKGDASIENFVIRFTNEEIMKKWQLAVETQRRECIALEQARIHATDAPAPEFAWMHGQTEQLENPYAEHEDEEDEEGLNLANSGGWGQQYQAQRDSEGGNQFPGQQQSTFSMNRNASSTSLRSRSTTGESTQSIAGMVRQGAPSRFPMPLPLSLQTQVSGQGQAHSPGLRGPAMADSYFSPVVDSPASSRTSQTSMYPFPRQGTPQGYGEAGDQNRYTAPAQINRAPSRESQSSMSNGGYSRNPQRPSLPVMSSQGAIRTRSFSTPDINAQINSARRREMKEGGVPAVPGIPAHLHPAYDHGLPRSSNGSPVNGLPTRAGTSSPGVQRERLQSHMGGGPANGHMPPPYSRANTTIPIGSKIQGIEHNGLRSGSMSSQGGQGLLDSQPSYPGHQTNPSTSTTHTHRSQSSVSGATTENGLPTQLKVKVNCSNNYVTLVVSYNISYATLVDRIDAKIGRFSSGGSNSGGIGKGGMRLRYRDEDGDFVTIDGDEGVQEAWAEWREMGGADGGLGEIELFCSGVE